MNIIKKVYRNLKTYGLTHAYLELHSIIWLLNFIDKLIFTVLFQNEKVHLQIERYPPFIILNLVLGILCSYLSTLFGTKVSKLIFAICECQVKLSLVSGLPPHNTNYCILCTFMVFYEIIILRMKYKFINILVEHQN